MVASGRWFHPNVVFAIDEIKQHLFVIAAQTNHALWILKTKFADMRDAARNVGSSIDQIAKKDQVVIRSIARKHVEQSAQLCTATVYVSNDESFHSENTEGIRKSEPRVYTPGRKPIQLDENSERVRERLRRNRFLENLHPGRRPGLKLDNAFDIPGAKLHFSSVGT
jgi:hypothetical protein